VPADDWAPALETVLREPQRIRVEYQPIVDLRGAVIGGYEALARFPDAPGVSPRDWFDAAARLGCAGALEARVVQAALVAHSLLVGDRFIAVKVTAAALLSDEVGAVMRAAGDLGHIVVEISECADGADAHALEDAAAALRAGGAAIAVHGIERHAALGASYVKVHCDAVDHPASPCGAAMVAERIETSNQLDAAVAAGVPFGQGFALGRPTPAFAELRPALQARIRAGTR
jgi:EAL domain-containing protein (putative c-di-GMP-specific phosphodiesterase class I)